MSGALVIGASGLVGSNLHFVLESQGLPVTAAYHSHAFRGGLQLDLSSREQVLEAVRACSPDFIFIAGAQPNVDYCQTAPEKTYRVNVEGVVNVVGALREARCAARIVYFSSDYVFDGAAGPYTERDPVNPLNEYGRQKVAAELFLAQQAASWLVIRTTGVYGREAQGKNFVYRVLRSLRSGETLAVPCDQVSTPTPAYDLARAAAELALKGAGGVYNVSGPDRISRCQFARQVARAFELDETLIQAVPTAALGQAAPRPLNAGLVSHRLEEALGWRPAGCKQALPRLAKGMMGER